MSVKELARTRPQTPVTVVIPAYEAADTVRAAVDWGSVSSFSATNLRNRENSSTLASLSFSSCAVVSIVSWVFLSVRNWSRSTSAAIHSYPVGGTGIEI